MGWPQITYIVLLSMSGTLYALKHGKPREPWNFGHWIVSVMIVLPLLYFGGFFGK